MATPYMTSTDIINAVKRKISVPISQNTFSEDDILAFANEEMMISQVPSVLEFHQEYYVTTVEIPIVANQSHYAIPDRAIGMKLRDLFFKDQAGNLFEMTRTNSDDRAYFQANLGSASAVYKFYLQGNDVVLQPSIEVPVPGSLLMVYFIRPNQLVQLENAAFISNFVFDITADNTNIVAGDTITIGDTVFTAVASSPGALEFEIGASSNITAANIATAITADGTYAASVVTSIVTVMYEDRNLDYSTSNSLGFVLSSPLRIQFEDMPEIFQAGEKIDFLETKAGHRIKGISVELGANSISGTVIEFEDEDVPTNLVVGDYICLENECVIPYLPSDLHIGLVERTCARILAAIGDQQGLQTQMAKIQEVDQKTGSLIDSRVEGAPMKVLARHSILRFGKMGPRRNM